MGNSGEKFPRLDPIYRNFLVSDLILSFSITYFCRSSMEEETILPGFSKYLIIGINVL